MRFRTSVLRHNKNGQRRPFAGRSGTPSKGLSLARVAIELALSCSVVPAFAQPARMPAGTESVQPDRERTARTQRDDGRIYRSVAMPADPAALVESMDHQHPLARGDRVMYLVVEDKDDALELVVSDLGELTVPYLGHWKAEGKTCRVLAGEIKQALEKELYRQATVVLSVEQLSGRRGVVYLAGEVRNIGPQILPSEEKLTLGKAILKAGGFGDFASRKKVRIMRRKGGSSSEIETLQVDVKSVLEGGKIENDVELQPGDFIYVPSRLINF